MMMLIYEGWTGGCPLPSPYPLSPLLPLPSLLLPITPSFLPPRPSSHSIAVRRPIYELIPY